jgi:hypothetical protein
MDQHPAREIHVPMARQVKAVHLLHLNLLRSKVKIRQMAEVAKIKSKTSRERMQKRHCPVEQILKRATKPLCLSKVREEYLPLANKKQAA